MQPSTTCTLYRRELSNELSRFTAEYSSQYEEPVTKAVALTRASRAHMPAVIYSPPPPPPPWNRGSELLDAACSTFIDTDKRDGDSNYYGGRRLPAMLQPCLYPLLATLGGGPYSVLNACANRNLSMVVSFYPSERGERHLKARLPYINSPRSQRDAKCYVALVDSSYNVALNPTNWSLRHVGLCWPDDAERSAHLIKTAIPMLFPSSPFVWYGDSKCKSNVAPYEWLGHRLKPQWRWNQGLPSRLLTLPSHVSTPLQNYSPPDILVVRHIAKNHTTRAELASTVQHLRRRGSNGLGNKGRRVPGSVREKLRHAVHDVMLQRLWYESVGYEMDGVESAPPDSMCLMWHNTETAWKFGCRWSMEVSMLSMREQLSFHHAAPASLHVQWETFPVDYLIGVL